MLNTIMMIVMATKDADTLRYTFGCAMNLCLPRTPSPVVFQQVFFLIIERIVPNRPRLLAKKAMIFLLRALELQITPAAEVYAVCSP